MNFSIQPALWACALATLSSAAMAQTPASVSYTPTWASRHHLQWLADHAGLSITVTHWPLPAAAVEQALEVLDLTQSMDAETAKVARDFVRQELAQVQSQARVHLHLRTPSEGLAGYGDSYTPGSRVLIASAEKRWTGESVSAAGRLGLMLEADPNAMPVHVAGASHPTRYPLRPTGSEAVVAWRDWNVLVFSRNNWWGPGWQSSLINGHNSPAWQGLGVQRGTVQPSDSAWLSWMGPWSLEVYVAQAQDPVVVPQQPSGFIFSGMRLTMKPKPWLEVGLSRGLQTGGAGRPGGVKNFLKAFAGQEVNQNPGDPEDSSGQIAGYDARLSCPAAWGCAAYTQWIGEDAAGSTVPLPFKFMSLWGVEKTDATGRYRGFAEWTDANAYSLPWDTKPSFPGLVNGVYRQGYTQGARWVGPAQGSGSQVLTLGWMDVQAQRQIKLHAGKIGTSIGSYSPTLDAPRGRMWGWSASQSFDQSGGLKLTPEFAYTQLAEGQNQGASRRHNWRLGVMMSRPL